MNRRQFSQLIAGAALGNTVLRSDGQAMSPVAPQRFRFSVMLWTLDKQAPLDRCIEIAAAAGYQGVELVREFWSWSPEEIRRLMTRMRGLGLVFDAMDGGKKNLVDPSVTGAFLAQLTAAIAIAKEIECPQIILTSGNRVDSLSADAQRAGIIDNLKRAADLVSKNDMQIALEPIDRLEKRSAYLNSVTDGFEIVKAIGSPNLKVLYDFYHEQRAAGNLIEKLEQNIDWVGLVHIADVPGRHEPGTGEIDYANIYRKLTELKYDKFIAMEFRPTGDPVELLRKARLEAQQAERTA